MHVISVCTVCFSRSNEIEAVYSRCGSRDEADLLDRFSSKKVRKLFEELREARENLVGSSQKTLSVLVFVQMRQTAMIMAEMLNKAAMLANRSTVARGLEFIKADYAVGHSKRHLLKKSPGS